MRSMLTATLMLVAAGASAHAQMTRAVTDRHQAEDGHDRTDPPGLQTPADTANAMAQAERLAIQSDLAWVGQYNGAITGEVSERMVAAIKEFQKDRGGKQTGVLNPQERSVLAETARRRQENVGWKIVTDAGTGARLGVPTKLVPQQSSDANGAKWSSSTGTIQIQLSRRKQANPTTAKLAEQEKKEPAGRKVDYTRGQAGFLRAVGHAGPEEILRARHVQGRRGPHPHHPLRPGHRRHRGAGGDRDVERLQPVSIGQRPAAAQDRRIRHRRGRQRRRRHRLTDREITDGCLAIAIAGFGNADRVAEDKDHDLALLRIYGARGLKPLALGNGAAKSAVELTGIADPQNQGGGAAASSVKAQAAQVGGGSEAALSPAPALGFSGAAALDATASSPASRC